MKILALDTATENCSAALLIDGRLLAREQLLEREHAARILPMIDELLGAAGVALPELTAIAFGRGPGAFTGVRLAASITQGLAFGAQLPVVPISDLRAVAQRVLDADPRAERVLVCNDARMHEVYWGSFRRGAQDLAVAVGDEHVSAPSAVAPPAGWAGPGTHGAGTGFAAYPELQWAVSLPQVHEGLLPRAAEMARMAEPEVQAGRILPAEQALPVYLRDSVTHRPTP